MEKSNARRYGAAVSALTNALELDPHFDMAHAYLAELHLDAGEYELALAQLERIEANGGEFAPQPHRVRVLARMGDRKGAAALLRALLDRADHEYISPAILAVAHANRRT